MEQMNIKSAKYTVDSETEENIGIHAFVDNLYVHIPLDPANRHYAEIMRQVEAGTLVIQPADEPETTE